MPNAIDETTLAIENHGLECSVQRQAVSSAFTLDDAAVDLDVDHKVNSHRVPCAVRCPKPRCANQLNCEAMSISWSVGPSGP